MGQLPQSIHQRLCWGDISVLGASSNTCCLLLTTISFLFIWRWALWLVPDSLSDIKTCYGLGKQSKSRAVRIPLEMCRYPAAAISPILHIVHRPHNPSSVLYSSHTSRTVASVRSSHGRVVVQVSVPQVTFWVQIGLCTFSSASNKPFSSKLGLQSNLHFNSSFTEAKRKKCR